MMYVFQALTLTDPNVLHLHPQISEQLSAPARLGLASSDGDPQLYSSNANTPPTYSGSVSAASGTLIRKPAMR